MHHDPVAAELVDADEEPVTVSGRGALSAPPMRLSVEGNPWTDVIAWAGPWPLEERWWDTARRRRRARLQLVTADGQARLATLERGTVAGRSHLRLSSDRRCRLVGAPAQGCDSIAVRELVHSAE